MNTFSNQGGFSMTELMVVIIIIGILAAIAIPRYNVFVARSRQGEAQANLGQLFKLQETYKLRHGNYDDGNAPAMNSATTATGYINETVINVPEVRDADGNVTTTGTTSHDCKANSLGFTLSNCDEVRYRYWIVAADENEFIVVATAFSDNTLNSDAGRDRRTEMRIFPNCSGAGDERDITQGNLASGEGGWQSIDTGDNAINPSDDADRGDTSKGDAWYIDQNRNLVNYRDVVDYCS